MEVAVVPSDMLQVFVRLSLVLTAEPLLDRATAQRHLGRLQADADAAGSLPELLQRFAALGPAPADPEQQVRDQVLVTDDLRRLARRIVVLWYTGGLLDGSGRLDFPEDDASAHFGALLWSVIGAHPPALSGGYFGYWRYPPES